LAISVAVSLNYWKSSMMHRLRQWEYWGSDYMWSRDFYVKMSDVWRLSVGESNETSRSLELL
jgi:hypothetical protein